MFNFETGSANWDLPSSSFSPSYVSEPSGGGSGFWGSLGSGIASAARGVGRVLSSPGFQPFAQTAAQLGGQYLSSVMARRNAPPPSAYASAPRYSSPYSVGAAPLPMVRRAPMLPSGLAPAPPGSSWARVSGQPVQAGMPSGWGTAAIAGGTALLANLYGGSDVNGFSSFLDPTGTSGGGFLGEVGERLAGAVRGGTTMFRYGPTRARAVPLVAVPHPETGQPVYFRHVGRPLIFSGDVATARRVRRVASRLSTQLGTRRRSSR